MGLPQRIVCLTEETTEFLYLLGEEHRIVGISAYTVRPPRAKAEKPVVSAFIGGSLSKIKALEPDLVLGFSDVQADFAASLIRSNLPVHIFNQRSLEEILNSMELLGHMIGAGERAAEWANRWRGQVDETRKRAALRENIPRVYFEEWDDPMLSGIQWVRETIEAAGGTCLFNDKASGAKAEDRKLTPSDVVEAAPDVVLASWCGKPFDRKAFMARPGFKTLPAVLNSRVHEVDSSIILQPGPALFMAALPLVEALLHPERPPESK
jgi:iron complex transport system substrate-binding protein